MKKTKTRIFTAMLMALLCMTVFPTTAFAGGGEDYAEPTPEPTETPAAPVPLTPEGNLSLVDDIEGEQAEDKQFVTMQSKNGNYFYLIIDRAGKEDNVYFLNLVDEADLLALIEDETPQAEPPKMCGCTEKCEAGSVKTSCPVCVNEMDKCIGKTADAEQEPAPAKKNNNTGILAILLIAALGGGGVFYYFKVLKNKPKTKGSSDLSEYEFDEDTDDEEYEVEDDTEGEDESEADSR